MSNRDKNARTAIYIRVSTEEQAREGFSINAQQEKLKQYAFARGWDIVDFYIDDGISGKNLKDRPEVMRMLEDVNSGKVSNVLVYKIDRLTRSTKNLIELIELFDKKNCAFNSLTEAIDTTSATGRMFIKIVGIFAEFERENLAERVSFGYEQKTREGNYTNALGVFGYDYVNGTGDLLLNEYEASVVREIYALYLQGESMTKICKHMVKKQVPTKRGGQWCQSTIQSILTNPLYIGKVRYGVQNNREPIFCVDSERYPIILDEDTFYHVQEIMKKRKKYATKKYPSENAYFLTFLMCAKCGMRFGSTQHKDKNVKTGRVYVRYDCGNRRNGNCDCSSMSQVRVEKAFQEYIEQYSDFDLASAQAALKGQKSNSDSEKRRQEYQKEIAKNEKRASEIRALFLQEKFTFEEYREFSTALNEKSLLLYEELKKIQEEEQEQIELEMVKDIIVNLKENWKQLTNEEKKQFLTMFVDYIKIYSDGNEMKIAELKFSKVKHM